MLPSPVLDWILATTGVPVSAAVPLPGGTHAATHLIQPTDLVLRRFPADDSAAARGARALTALALRPGTEGPAVPRLVAVDTDGSATGTPAMLTTRVPGRAALHPADPAVAVAELAAALVWLHAAPPADLPEFHREDIHSLWENPVLSHGDYWTGNTLWTGHRLSGVIDWDGACLAPRGHDVSWCRLDLALLHGSKIADMFRDAYEAAAGPVPHLADWDRSAAAHSTADVESWTGNYASLGRADLDPAELRRRHTAWAASLG